MNVEKLVKELKSQEKDIVVNSMMSLIQYTTNLQTASNNMKFDQREPKKSGGNHQTFART